VLKGEANTITDGDINTATFCTKRVSVSGNLFQNKMAKFNKNYNLFENTFAPIFAKCFDSIKNEWHTEWYKYNHQQLVPYKRRYKGKVAKSEFIMTARERHLIFYSTLLLT